MAQDETSQDDPKRPIAPGGFTDPEPAAETQSFTPREPTEISDVVLAEPDTGDAPSFRVPAAPPARTYDAAPTIEIPERARRAGRDTQRPMALLPGAKVDDFEIIKLLGRGAFGHVYLARQISLDRQVALKISANRGSEGRTMARLEHQHIVQVFSETVDKDFNQRLLCMQLVPGIGLEKLIAKLHGKGEKGKPEPNEVPKEWTGAQMLAIIDQATSLPTALDPSALHDREALARMDAVEATAWFGGRLAEALDFAHRHGVLHRDIKPANVLVNSYGRPMLADFNISSQPLGSEAGGEEMFGGTFAYMAPEHLDAFNPDDPTGHDAVTGRSDLYSLGLVLEQLLEGRLCFPMPKRGADIIESLRKMSEERWRARPVCRPGPPGARKTLERSIGRCLEPEPKDRFASGAELAKQLDGCRQLRQAERQLPRLPRVLSGVVRRPFLWLILMVVLPQLAGSAVNIAYNATQIGDALTTEQKRLFAQLIIGYNALVYPIALTLFVLAVRPVWKCWNALASAEPLADGYVESARRKALRLPLWTAALTALGWFPGGFLFPAIIYYQTLPRLGMEPAAHFVISFCMSGLIALAYSLCGVEFVVLRALYPGMWRNARDFESVAQEELTTVPRHLLWIVVLAVAIPLLAALMLLFLGNALDMIRILAAALIVLGIAGLVVAFVVNRVLSRVVAALTGAKA
ncbi:MAG TPA: serine/threonine-protein kinase [Lacipirellulaceae bacterium]